MDTAELLDRLGRLRQAQRGNVRKPHKPLLLLWLFGRFAATGSSAASYAETEEPVDYLINQFGPAVQERASALGRAADPFVRLDPKLWDPRDAAGTPISPSTAKHRRPLLDRGAVGRLREPVEILLADPATLARASRLLLDCHFTPVLATLICDTVGLDLPALDATAAAAPAVWATRRVRRRQPAFTMTVLRVYAFACAMCGFDGALGPATPVGVEAAHVRWHSQHGPDEVANGLALCALHHALFDLGVLGLTQDHTVKVSRLYVARSDAGQAVHALAGRPLARPRPGQPPVHPDHVAWHSRQVFRDPAAA